MATVKVLELQANTDNAQASLNDVVSALDNINKTLTETDKEFKNVNEDAKKVGETVEKSSVASISATKGFKKMGLALKGIGIGLIIKGFAIVQDLFNSNQKIVNGFNTAIGVLTISFNDLFKFIEGNVGSVASFFKTIFDDPLGSINRLAIAIRDNFIERINSGIKAIGLLATAVKQVFERDFDGAIQSAKQAGKEYIDVLTGVDNSVDKISEVVTEAIPKITEYAQSTFEAAQAQVELANKTEIAAALNQGLIEKFDRQAEQQRQIRDDERKSVEERLAANQRLGELLDEQEIAMKANAQDALKLANQQLALDEDNVEAQVAKIEALNELAAIEATVDGFRSEQLTNEASLEKELLELKSSKLESEANLSIEQKRFNAEQIQDDLQRLEAQEKIDAEEKKLQTERLQTVIDNANAGTQAKIDAEIALNEFLEQARQQEVTREKEIADTKKKIDNDLTASKIKNQDAIINATLSALSSISQIATANAGEDEVRAKKAFKLNKALGIAQAIISTSQGIMNAYANPVDVASGVAFAKSAAIGLAGVAQIATIKATKFKPQGGDEPTPDTDTQGGGISAPSQPPSFNVVGQSGFNQIAGALTNQSPVQAFVVAGEVTTQQQLDNAIVSTATLGN